MMETSFIILTPASSQQQGGGKRRRRREEGGGGGKRWRRKWRGVRLTGFVSLWEWRRRRRAAFKSPSGAESRPLRGGGGGGGGGERGGSTTHLFVSLSLSLSLCNAGEDEFAFSSFPLSEYPPTLMISLSLTLLDSLYSYWQNLFFSIFCCW